MQGREQGFAVLQMLIVFAIVAAVAGIGLPVYASRAKDVVLGENVENLEMQVKGILAADEDACVAEDAVPAALASALRAGDAGRFVNPLSGSDAVVCQASLPADAGSPAPAVWITDDARYAHEEFAASALTSSGLAGTLVVVFVSHGVETDSIDVFYVDGAGHSSDRVETLASLGG